MYSVWNGRKGRNIAQTRKENDQKTPIRVRVRVRVWVRVRVRVRVRVGVS